MQELGGDLLGVRRSASRASSGSAHWSSQSSSGIPSPPMARTCGIVHMGVDEPGQQHPAAQVLDRFVRVVGPEIGYSAAGDDGAVPYDEPPSRSTRSTSAGSCMKGLPATSMTVAR